MLTNHVVPRSTAKNLYDLLDDFCEVVTLQPKRVYMPDVVRTFRDRDAGVTIYPDNYLSKSVAGPACGTIGCIAGWMKIMTRTKEWTPSEKDAVKSAPRQILNEMEQMFPGSQYDPTTLQFKAMQLFTTGFPDSEKYGTRAYGRHVVKAVRTFMKEHQTELKAAPVVR